MPESDRHDNLLDYQQHLLSQFYQGCYQHPQQRIKNTLDASKIYKSIFEDLYKILNNLHGVNFNLKAWKILLGHWLTRFIDLCFQKDFLIQEILNSNEIDKIYGIKNDEFILASEDTFS